jgi:membrane-associated phospholipid phosphatase
MAWKYELQDAVHTLGGQDRFPFEDYVQYVPALAAVSADWLGVRAEHETADRLMLSATSYAVTAGLTWALLKRTVVSIRPGIHYTYVASGREDEITPDANPKYFNSFPSGHSATAFMGAELVRLEYGREHPWLAVGAYAVATGVGVMRIYHDYHWFTDVLAGAGMGILGARIGWWLLPYERRLFHSLFKNDIAIRPVTDGSGAALALSLSL